MKKFLGFLCMTLTLFILGNSAWADTYTGSIFSSDDTMFASQEWLGNAKLSWDVDDTTHDGYWTYSYNWSTESKDLSHIF